MAKQTNKTAWDAKPLLLFISALSALTSFAFVFFGLSVVANEGLQQGGAIFAYVTAGYGLGNIYVLSSAWRSGGSWPAAASKLMGLCFLAVLVFETINTGMTSPIILLGRLGVVLVLWANWFSIKKISTRSEG